MSTKVSGIVLAKKNWTARGDFRDHRKDTGQDRQQRQTSDATHHVDDPLPQRQRRPRIERVAMPKGEGVLRKHGALEDEKILLVHSRRALHPKRLKQTTRRKLESLGGKRARQVFAQRQEHSKRRYAVVIVGGSELPRNHKLSVSDFLTNLRVRWAILYFVDFFSRPTIATYVYAQLHGTLGATYIWTIYIHMTKTKTRSLAVLGAFAFAVAGTFPVNAVTLDLTTSTTSGTINGANFVRSDAASTGTGVIQSFVRLSGNGTAEGYNANARPVMSDVNTSPTFTHDLLLSSVPIVNGFYEFLLDINQTSANPFLSLDELRIYTRATALASASQLSDLTAAGSNLRYNMDAGDAANEVLLNYNLNSGSGSGDLFVYIPIGVFGPTSDFVYLYSKFGAKGGDYAENDGFEEWAVRTATTGIPGVPDGGTTVLLLGAGLTALAALRRKIA